MKTLHFPKLAFSITVALILTSIQLDAQSETRDIDPFAETNSPDTNKQPTSIHVYTELIEISSIQYAEIMSDPITSSDHTVLRNKLLEQIKVGKANLISNQSILVRPDERATTESIQEYIYPTEYEPGPPPSAFNKRAKNKHFKKLSLKHYPTISVAFETRNIGTTIELEPVLDEDTQTINLVFQPEAVKHASNYVHTEWNTSAGKMHDQLPIFYTIRTNASFPLANNQFSLVSTHSPELNGKADETRKYLYFVRASILKVIK